MFPQSASANLFVSPITKPGALVQSISAFQKSSIVQTKKDIFELAARTTPNKPLFGTHQPLKGNGVKRDPDPAVERQRPALPTAHINPDNPFLPASAGHIIEGHPATYPAVGHHFGNRNYPAAGIIRQRPGSNFLHYFSHSGDYQGFTER